MNTTIRMFDELCFDIKTIIMWLLIITAIVIMFTCYTTEYFNPEHFNIIKNNITVNGVLDKTNDSVSDDIINAKKTINAKWSRNKCDYQMPDTILDELKNNGIVESATDWSLFFPCAYDNIVQEINMMPVVNGAKYFILENCDEIVAKELLWKNVVQHFDYPIAKTMMPNSYILYDQNDLNKFNNEYDSSKIYIMKKNIQRQEGLKITNNKHEILHGFGNGGYVLVQELLQNPYTISGRKTNMRFYVLVLCKGNDINVFVHKNGFMYYTKDLFKVGSKEDGPNITTGYIDRQVYVDNPLTHDDLVNYLDDNQRQLLDAEKNIRNQGLKVSQVVFDKIYHLIRQTFMAFHGKLNNVRGVKKFNDTNITFQLFGVDVAVDDKLNPTIMEVNKGPDLGAKDARDSALKHGVVKDIFKIIGVIPTNTCYQTHFVKVLDIVNGVIGLDNKALCTL